MQFPKCRRALAKFKLHWRKSKSLPVFTVSKTHLLMFSSLRSIPLDSNTPKPIVFGRDDVRPSLSQVPRPCTGSSQPLPNR